ncbi:MAG TPA: hypothetical protein VJN69_15455 [Candidatus Acidoferrales bacterium]|nr:hypothetical protein [Candidatus Acidoferrales bacterium]
MYQRYTVQFIGFVIERGGMQVLDIAGSPHVALQVDHGEAASPLAYSVGGICVGVFAAPGLQLELDPELFPFHVSLKNPDVRIEVDWTSEIVAPSGPLIFESGGLWSLYEEYGGYTFHFSTPRLGATPYKTAWFDHEFRFGHVSMLRRFYDVSQPVNALEYPLDELVTIHRLALGEGVEVHALGVVDEFNRGHLFIGHSGAGKSTSARLWQKRPGARVLSDDRIILRCENGRTRMYGTPWHGDAGLALAESANLFGIYVLAHGTRNKLTRLPAGRAAAELLARSFVPHHSAEGLEFTLQILDRITREIPCSRFEFVPDQSALEVICRA